MAVSDSKYPSHLIPMTGACRFSEVMSPLINCFGPSGYTPQQSDTPFQPQSNWASTKSCNPGMMKPTRRNCWHISPEMEESRGTRKIKAPLPHLHKKLVAKGCEGFLFVSGGLDSGPEFAAWLYAALCIRCEDNAPFFLCFFCSAMRNGKCLYQWVTTSCAGRVYISGVVLGQPIPGSCVLPIHIWKKRRLILFSSVDSTTVLLCFSCNQFLTLMPQPEAKQIWSCSRAHQSVTWSKQN